MQDGILVQSHSGVDSLTGLKNTTPYKFSSLVPANFSLRRFMPSYQINPLDKNVLPLMAKLLEQRQFLLAGELLRLIPQHHHFPS